MKKNIFLSALLLLTFSFLEARIERTLINNKIITLLEEDDVIEYGTYKFRCGDYFFPLETKLSLNEFYLKRMTEISTNQDKTSAFIAMMKTWFTMPGFLEERNFFVKTIGKPYFSLNPQFFNQLPTPRHSLLKLNDYYFSKKSQQASFGPVQFVLVFYDKNFYQINDISSIEEAIKIFNDLLEEDPNVFNK